MGQNSLAGNRCLLLLVVMRSCYFLFQHDDRDAPTVDGRRYTARRNFEDTRSSSDRAPSWRGRDREEWRGEQRRGREDRGDRGEGKGEGRGGDRGEWRGEREERRRERREEGRRDGGDRDWRGDRRNWRGDGGSWRGDRRRGSGAYDNRFVRFMVCL